MFVFVKHTVFVDLDSGVLLVMRSLFSQTHSRPGERPVWYFHMLGLCTSYNYDDDQDGFGGDGK